MATNYPGPYTLEQSYAVSGLTHKMNLSCALTTDPDPGDLIGTLSLETRGGTPVTLSTAYTAWIDLLRPFYNTGVQFNEVNLWRNTPGSFERTYIGSMLIDVAGSSGSATYLSGQEIFTFRTVEGNSMRLTLMETIQTPAASVPRAAATGVRDALFDFVESTDNWILARDTSYPIVGIAFHPGQNEATFKARYRNL